MKKKIFIILAAIVAFTLMIAPAFSQDSSWRAYSISKIFTKYFDTIYLSNVQATNIWFLANDEMKDSSKIDSLIFNVRSVGKKPFSSQIRLTSDSSKIQGQVLKVVSATTDLERFALAIKDFKIKAFNTIRFYMNVGDKSGWEISGVQFKEKYVPVEPPAVVQPQKPQPSACKDSITLIGSCNALLGFCIDITKKNDSVFYKIITIEEFKAKQ